MRIQSLLFLGSIASLATAQSATLLLEVKEEGQIFNETRTISIPGYYVTMTNLYGAGISSTTDVDDPSAINCTATNPYNYLGWFGLDFKEFDGGLVEEINCTLSS